MTVKRKYRKKPIVIEAQQFWPRGDERHDPTMVTERKGNTVTPPDYRQVGDLYLAVTRPDIYMIRTLEGDLKVSPGDWIITGVAGEKYPCKPEIFAATYELVEIDPEASCRAESKRCPACNSPSQKLHPAVQYEGEVELCHHEFHTKGKINA